MDAFADDSDRFSFHAKKTDGYESDEPKKSQAYRDDDRRDRHHDDRRDRDSRRDQDRDRHRRRDDSDDRGSKRQRNDGSHGRKDEDEPLPELFSIHKGKVVSIQSYGVFVEMENLRRHGLVHISQATSSRLQGKEDLEQVWVVGDSIWVKVIAIGGDKKISLSAKYGDGRDLDVNQVDLMMADRRKKPGWVERGPIQLDAILHTNCTRCGGKGHIAAECYAAKGQKGYELLDSPPREPEIPKKPEHKHHEEHKHHNEHRHYDEHKHRHDEDHKHKQHDDKHKHKDKKEKKDKSEKKHKKHKKDKKDKSEKKHKKED